MTVIHHLGKLLLAGWLAAQFEVAQYIIENCVWEGSHVYGSFLSNVLYGSFLSNVLQVKLGAISFLRRDLCVPFFQHKKSINECLA